MKVLLVGNGGREHALAWRIAQSPTLVSLTVTGHNPGWPSGVIEVSDSKVEALVSYAQKEQIDLVVVGPEAPLAAGLSDALESCGIPCFGPSKAAAQLESSKAFAKEIMMAAGVPTAGYLRVNAGDQESVRKARARCDQGEVVVKVDGLAAGKGVFVCTTPKEAHAALDEVWGGRFGDAGQVAILEDKLVGPEVSVFGICDGENVVALPSSQDHKTLNEGNRGPNTGGMGAYVPCPLVSFAEADAIVQSVHLPVMQEMARRGTPFKGVLYAGLMMTPAGAKVLEFNVRFGDPECQPLMHLWEEDILPWLFGAATGSLPEGQPEFSRDSACCIVLASAGYPRSSTKGVEIPDADSPEDVVVFFAGARRDPDSTLRTNGGRVLGVCARGEDINGAAENAYKALESWKFPGCQFRTDIAGQARTS